MYEHSKTTLYNPEIPRAYEDQDDWLFRTLSEATAIATGDHFFELLVESLAKAYGIGKVYVTECVDSDRVRTLSHWNQGEFARNGEYTITGLPCELIMQGKLLYFPHSLKAFFTKVRYESYVGVPLFGSKRTVIGHIVMEETVPLAETLRGITALRVFAARAAAELERYSLERERDLAYQTLEQRVHERTAEIERRRAVAASLQGILAKLNAAESAPAILSYIAQNGCELFGGSASIVCTAPDGKPGTHLITAAFGLDGSASERLSTAALPGAAIIQQAVSENMPTCIHWDGAQQPPVLSAADAPADEQVAGTVHSMLAIPLMLTEDTSGCLALYFSEPQQFSTATVELAATYGDQVNLALHNRRLRQAAEQAATLEERNRLAHELHDAVSQTLWSASLLADVVPELWQRDIQKGQQRLEQLRQLNRVALAELRALLLELRPSALVDVPMSSLLRQLVDSIRARTNVAISLEVDGDYTLDPHIQVTIYRIAQESLNNTLRHAHATHIVVTLHHQPPELSLTVCDDGDGFESIDGGSGSLGLRIMRERAASIAAELAISSAIGMGTTIQLRWSQPAVEATKAGQAGTE
ncbi:MAG: GAF domain-containing protein [Caldilineaceae bacterium]|nr:GAF domain-containing protein [Caldilineaceae bacterium]